MTPSKPAPSQLDLTDVQWQKSSYTGGSGNCVEIATAQGYILIRDSKAPECAPHVFTRGEIAAFFAGVRKGEFDHVIGG